jgi:hypothetical protein
MADPVLAAGQYSIGAPGSASAFVFGGRQGNFANSIQISSTQWDTGTMNTQDTAVVGHDGTLFGIDTMGAMMLTQTGQVYIPGAGAAAMDAYGALAAAWNDPSVRLQNNKVVVLRALYPGSSAVHRCYGRGRKIQPVPGLVNQGIIPFTSQFEASDGIWYGDTDNSITITPVRFGQGFLAPVISPVAAAQMVSTTRDGTLSNTGPQWTWPVFTFTGPSANPGVSYPDAPVSLTWRGVLSPGDTLVIDTRPWARTALLNGVNAAGALFGDPMISFQLPPGNTRVRYVVLDPFGVSHLQVNWRNAYLFAGGQFS